MGIYSAKMALESAVSPEDVINTPGDVGADLDEIEKAIAGPDGLEANREEIEAAQTGLIGDPIEEAYVSIYESEYNYNQIMHTIGIHELSAVASGREFILEAADRDGFFKQVSNWLKEMFAKVVKAFKYAIGKIAAAVADDKKFAEKHKDAIIGGGKGDWTAKGFVYKDKIEFDKSKFASTDWARPAIDKINDIKTTNSSIIDLGNFDEIQNKIFDKAAKGATDLTSVKEILYKELRNGEDKPVEINSSKIDGNDVYRILTGDNEAKAIRAAYDEVKNSYKESQKTIEQLKAAIKKNENDYTNDGLSRAFAVCDFYLRAVKSEKQVQQIVSATLIKTAEAKRAQARKLAVSFISNYKKPADAPKANHESSLFGNISLI